MQSFYRKYWRTAFDIGLIALTVYLLMYAFSFVYRIATPVLLAFVIFYLMEPMARFMHKRGMKKSIAAAIAIIVLMLIVLLVFVGLGAIVATQVIGLISAIESNSAMLQEHILQGVRYVQEQYNALPVGAVEQIQSALAGLSDWATGFAGTVLNYFVGIVTSFSTFLFNFSIAVVLAYFLSIEIPFWRRTAETKTPKTFKKAFVFLRDNVLLGLMAYIKAQLKLIGFTFAIVFMGLLLLRIDNAFSLALLAGLFDVLPLLGVSAVFLPWIAYCFITGNIFLGVSLSVLLAIVLTFRQIMEPKITGDSLGVSAFTVLSAMMISMSLFGVAGLILSPILIILLKALYEQGYLKRWIRMPPEEYERTDL
ncbi:sporulation integral membrane protein YtvI [Paenibacillus antri]|uniref:Sporulation integral membrane protein YtvI n=1 Tax=Paenibacillus antri TaxID=2582848 RepID=A0A5R9G438_9BACL|nr:sporulation integral membrane protein YtvI [Paenibacillus antri]TLS48258.1 sporulation integral membrane protein YtvI [Paenibacillus antri]